MSRQDGWRAELLSTGKGTRKGKGKKKPQPSSNKGWPKQLAKKSLLD